MNEDTFSNREQHCDLYYDIINKQFVKQQTN